MLEQQLRLVQVRRPDQSVGIVAKDGRAMFREETGHWDHPASYRSSPLRDRIAEALARRIREL